MAMQCEPKGINRFSLRQKLGLLLTLFESKSHIIIIFHLKTNRQKLEKHHVNGSQTHTLFCLKRCAIPPVKAFTAFTFWAIILSRFNRTLSTETGNINHFFSLNMLISPFHSRLSWRSLIRVNRQRTLSNSTCIFLVLGNEAHMCLYFLNIFFFNE